MTSSKDKYNNVYMGTRLGVLLFNEENNTTAILNTETSKGKLPDTNVYAVETDKNQRVWIGTEQGGTGRF
jgi:ligand-binding sensor domain-containing protein